MEFECFIAPWQQLKNPLSFCSSERLKFEYVIACLQQPTGEEPFDVLLEWIFDVLIFHCSLAAAKYFIVVWQQLKNLFDILCEWRFEV